MLRFVRDYRRFRSMAAKQGIRVRLKGWRSAYAKGQELNRHYWFQDIHVARKIIAASETTENFLHIDIGSRVEGFITSLIAAKVPLIFGDINVPKVDFPNTTAKFINLQNMDPEQFRGVRSVSCLHTIEHLGLGKYGDALDPDGHTKVFGDFARVLEPGTTLYISSPTSSKPGIVFNSSRHVDPLAMIRLAKDAGFKVIERAFVTSGWELEIDPPDDIMEKDPYGCLILTLLRGDDQNDRA